MSGFDKFLKKRVIKKTIDPGSSPPKVQLPTGPSTTTEGREVAPTSIQNKVQDVIAAAETTRRIVDGVIDEIRKANSSDPGFQRYADLVDGAFFDPRTLLEGERIPGNFSSAVELKRAERDVIRRLTDPRAGFLHDLKLMRYEIDATEYVAKRVWQNIVADNNLYERFETSRSVILGLDKELQYLRLIRFQANKYRDTVLSKLAHCVLEGFARKLHFKISDSFSVAEAVREVRKTIRAFRQLRAVLRISQIRLTAEDWEEIKDSIKTLIGAFAEDLGRRILHAGVFSVTNGISNIVSDLVDGLVDATEVSCPELTGMTNEVYEVLFRYKAKIEDYLSYREHLYIQSNKFRGLLAKKAKEISQNKQFIVIIDEAIRYLESLEGLLIASPQLFRESVDTTISMMENSLNEYAKKVAFEIS